MKNKPILYSFRRCPYAMRARIFIRMCEIEVELREVLLKDIPDLSYIWAPHNPSKKNIERIEKYFIPFCKPHDSSRNTFFQLWKKQKRRC